MTEIFRAWAHTRGRTSNQVFGAQSWRARLWFLPNAPEGTDLLDRLAIVHFLYLELRREYRSRNRARGNLMFQLDTQEIAALVVRIQEGDPAAEDELVRVFSQRVTVMMLARTRDPEAARELTQDVLFAVLKALRNGQMREAERLPAFVHGTARNLVNNYLRAQSRQPRTESLPPDLALAQTANDLEHSERMTLVHRALERLDSTDRKILLMTLVQGLKPSEIANQMNLTPEVVRQRKSRAVRKVIERIKRMSRR